MRGFDGRALFRSRRLPSLGSLWTLGLLSALLVLPARADLQELVRWQKQGDGGAYVSSGFHDWRSVSIYRRRPGLHAGYDIAMLAGSPVRTPWAGTVVAVTPWYGAEMGVTVQLENGWEATFGHITCAVRVGQRVRAGELLGRVVVDHVDVKMRGRSGAFVDFAVHKVPAGAAGLGETSPPDLPPPTDQEKRAAAAAFAEYDRVVALLAQEEAKIRLGLSSRKSVGAYLKKLDALRPLALQHTRWNGGELPGRPSIPLEESEAGRPVADFLLGTLPTSDDI